MDSKKGEEVQWEHLCCEVRARVRCGVDNWLIEPGQPVHTWVRVPKGTTIDDEDVIQKHIGDALELIGAGSPDLTITARVNELRKDPQPGQEGFGEKPKAEKIREVVSTLEQETDFHWVQKGRSKRIFLPSPYVVQDRLGEPVTAEEIAQACPTVKRDIRYVQQKEDAE